jgi:hypothetical protein
MRGLTVAALGSVVLLSSATGFAGDKSQSTFVNPVVLTGTAIPPLTPPVGAAWTNGVNKGKTKGDDKCKVQVQLGSLALPDSDGVPGTGDEVICTADANVTVSAALPISTTAVFRGEIVSGKVKIKVDLFAEGTGCVPSLGGGLGIAQYDGRITCYEPDPGYPPPPSPFLSDPTQGIYSTGYGPRPASPMIATQGLYFKP